MFRGKDLVAIELSTINLKIAHAGFVSPAKAGVSAVVSRNIRGLSDEDISVAVRESLDEMRIKNPVVISVIPSHLSIARNMQIPSVDPEEVDGIVNLQASRHTPYSREDIIVGYIKIGVHKTSHTKVLIVVVGRDKARRQFDILERAGLTLEKIVYGPEMLGRTFSRTSRLGSGHVPPKGAGGQAPSGIIHVDGAYTDFIITLNDIPIFIRNIPIGSQHLASKRTNYKTQFAEEMKRSLEVYQEEAIGEKPGGFILMKAAEGTGELKATLDDALQVPTETVNYSDSRHLVISAGASKAIADNKSVSFANLLASLFAYRQADVDFIPEDVKARKSFEERTRDIIKTGVLVIIMLFLITGILFGKIYFRNARLERLTARYQPIIGEAKTLERDFRRVVLAKSYQSAEGYSLEILAELYDLIPDDLCLSDIRFERGGNFSIRGVSKSRATVYTFVDSMTESEYFRNVKTRHTTKIQRDDEEVVDFEIVCVSEKLTKTSSE